MSGSINQIQNVYPDTTPKDPAMEKRQEGSLNNENNTKVVDISRYVHKKQSSWAVNNLFSHKEWEQNLWMANCLVIPLIVYPILSVFGHLVIELYRDPYAAKYQELSAYLQDNVTFSHGDRYSKEEIVIDKEMQGNIIEMFKEFKDLSCYKLDPLFITVQKNLNNSEEKEASVLKYSRKGL